MLALINGCDWRESSKLTLIELAFNPEKYISILERALIPVAAAFEACRGLWKPLVEAFDANFGLPEQYADILHERFGDIVPKAKDTMLFRQSRDSDKCFFPNRDRKTVWRL